MCSLLKLATVKDVSHWTFAKWCASYILGSDPRAIALWLMSNIC
jgi:hypothetical protein